jgi:hypothetical protein
MWGSSAPNKCVLITPNATVNQAEKLLTRGNGCSVHFDDDRTATSEKLIDDIAYMLASGTGKARMTKDCGDRPVTTWSTFGQEARRDRSHGVVPAGRIRRQRCR